MIKKEDTIEFRMHEEGNDSKKIVTIHLKKICCGIETKVYVSGLVNSYDSFTKGCSTHFNTYPKCWANRIIFEPAQSKIDIRNDGTMCNYCGDFYPMATANQPDGSLKCYSCRTSGCFKKVC